MSAKSQPHTGKLAEQHAVDTKPVSTSSAENRAQSRVTIACTPINHRELVTAEPAESGSIPLSAATPNGLTKPRRKRTAEYERPVEKRPKKATGRSHPMGTKQLPIARTPMPIQTSIDSLNVTKPMSKVQGPFFTEKNNATLSLASPAPLPSPRRDTQVHNPVTTIEQVTPYLIHTPKASLDPLHLEVARPFFHGHGQLTRRYPKDEILGTVHYSYTPEVTFGGIIENENTFSSSPVVKFAGTRTLDNDGAAPGANVTSIPNIGASDEQSDPNDAYPLDDDILDDDIIRLLADTSGSVRENHIPPSSIQGWDHDSRSATEYDAALRDTPPNQQRTGASTTKMEEIDTPEDLLDEDVDWNAVLVNANVIQKDPSVDSYSEIEVTKTISTAMCAKEPGDVDPHSDEAGALAPFVRPPFPESVRDRPAVPGISSITLLRTCFRIGVMISQTVRCFNHQQDVVFELYARVTYSNRETLVRKQHFQFVDLFKDQQPYPAATLTNWRIGSQLDKDSSAFLDTSGGPRLCWCMCKPLKEPRAAIGWTYTVLSIKEIDWDQIRWAKEIICGYSEEQHAEMMTAKL
ncbi:hypothetical protein HD806DRAFT_503210 [Xylariaceae sp. AK1471]|nr:hypothetical protein HD806DRAFT_503210 [Xylariaceae sp. AK1471]